MSTNELNNFFLEIINREEIKTILAITQKDLSSFVEICEDSLYSFSILNLEHLDNNAVEPKDLCIVFDDISISKTQIGLIKNTLAQKILAIQKNSNVLKTDSKVTPNKYENRKCVMEPP